MRSPLKQTNHTMIKGCQMIEKNIFYILGLCDLDLRPIIHETVKLCVSLKQTSNPIKYKVSKVYDWAEIKFK